MGYYLRYITTDSRPVTLAMLDSVLKSIDVAYAVIWSDIDDTSGDLFYAESLLGVLEVNRAGDDIFSEDIADLKELVAGYPNDTQVRTVLDQGEAIIAVEASWQRDNSEATLEKLDPLWNWLFRHYDGVLQADNEGFYDKHGLILEINLKI